MKKINGLLLLAFIVSILSCKKSDDSSPAPQLVGKWKDMGTKGSFTASFGGQTDTQNLDEPGTGEIIELKADGTVSDTSSDGVIFTKYKTDGSLLTFTVNDSGKTFEFTFNYAVSGKTLTLTMDKTLFSKNVASVATSGADNDLAFFKEILPLITDVKYTVTLEKQ